MRPTRAALTALLALLVPTGLAAPPPPAGASPAPGTTTTATTRPDTTDAHGGGKGGWARCTFTPTPDRPPARPVPLPGSRQRAHGTADVLVLTSYGPMVFRLERDGAPCAVGNLLHLARWDFYDRTPCFRLTDTPRLGVLQCGDLIRQEEGGPGYEFPDEVDGTETYPRGTLAMGNQGPGTNGSELFVVHSFAHIPPAYTVMGRLVAGYKALDAIVAAGIDDPDRDGPPARPVRILDVIVLRDGTGHRG